MGDYDTGSFTLADDGTGQTVVAMTEMTSSTSPDLERAAGIEQIGPGSIWRPILLIDLGGSCRPPSLVLLMHHKA